MNKAAFLDALRARLSGLAEADIINSLDYYSEMIDERMEDGLTEEEAVAAVGSVEQAAEQILSEIPLPRLIKHRFQRTRSLMVWEIILLILGAPLWLSVLAAVLALVLTVFIVLFSIVAGFFAVDVALIVAAAALVIGGVVLIFAQGIIPALMLISAGLIAAGLGLLLLPLFKLIGRAVMWLCRKLMLGIKAVFAS